jgi:hypothetical protein
MFHCLLYIDGDNFIGAVKTILGGMLYCKFTPEKIVFVRLAFNNFFYFKEIIENYKTKKFPSKSNHQNFFSSCKTYSEFLLVVPNLDNLDH